MQVRRDRPGRALLPALALALLMSPLGVEPAAAQDEHADEPEASTKVFRVGGLNNWIFRSFQNERVDDATALGLEMESYLTLGGLQVKNIAYIELADHPREIPGQPPGNPEPGTEPATGVSDLLTGFWFSKASGHHGRHHFAPGFAFQAPTGSSDTLGSGKWAIGPSFDYEYENGRFFAGAIALQIWSFAGDQERKDVSMLMIKPFIYYSLSDLWDLMSVPYGISVYWNKKPGERMYLPLGGGAQRLVHAGNTDINLGAQLFYNIVRPSNGTVWDLRLLVALTF